MAQRFASSLFSKLMTVIMVVACLVAAFWVALQALEPVPVPPLPPAKAQVKFDPKVDVSNNAMFKRLEPLGPGAIEAGTLGRVNPFAPVIPASAATGTSATTTTTLPELPPPPPEPVPENATPTEPAPAI